MSKAKRTARNFEPLYDKTGIAVLARKSATDLKQMISTGEAIRACRRCGGTGQLKRCNGKAQDHQLVYAATELFKASRRSPATLTLADMEANVGIAGGKDEGPRKGRIKAAQQKVKLWPLIGDRKAVRVGPRV